MIQEVSPPERFYCSDVLDTELAGVDLLCMAFCSCYESESLKRSTVRAQGKMGRQYGAVSAGTAQCPR